jgi:hypothetical protein
MTTIAQAQARLFVRLLERELSGKPSSIHQIDIEHEGDDVVAWVYFKPADDDCFAVSFKPPGPMPADEIRRLLTRDPLMVTQ